MNKHIQNTHLLDVNIYVLVAEPISTSTLQIVLVKRASNDSQKNNEGNKGEITVQQKWRFICRVYKDVGKFVDSCWCRQLDGWCR